ncbi:hypothetical protein EUZ95_05870 [Enterococcus durans]|nr:hypothetical protein EUZ95_05870 [Enterococcus durans]
MLDAGQPFRNLIHGVQRADLQQEVKKSQNMGSYFEIFILIAQVKTLFSQPLSTVFKAQLLEISLDFSKHGELFRKIHSYCRRS